MFTPNFLTRTHLWSVPPPPPPHVHLWIWCNMCCRRLSIHYNLRVAVHKLRNPSGGGGGSEGRLRTGYEKSIFVCYSIRGGVVLGNSGVTRRLREGGGKKRRKIGLRNLWTALLAAASWPRVILSSACPVRKGGVHVASYMLVLQRSGQGGAVCT